MTLLRHADRVRIACLAQLVNVIAPIRTIEGGPAWLQTTAYPFADVTRLGHGMVLDLALDGPAYAIAGGDRVPAIEAVAVHDAGSGHLTLFAVNRVERPLVLEADVPRARPSRRSRSTASSVARTSACRTRRPIPSGSCRSPVGGQRWMVGAWRSSCRPYSWNVVRMSVS